MVYAPCPACALHHVGAVSTPDCPVCAGEARISLNDKLALAEGYDAWPDREALWDHGVEKNVPESALLALGAGILCRAVWLGLARAARSTVGCTDVERVRVLRARLAGFRDSHVIDSVAPVTGPVLVPEPGDDALVAELDAVPAGPSFTRLPNGQPPSRSAAGHPSPLAMLLDPVDLDTPPGLRYTDHARVWRVADEIDRAVTLNASTHANPDDLVGAAA